MMRTRHKARQRCVRRRQSQIRAKQTYFLRKVNVCRQRPSGLGSFSPSFASGRLSRQLLCRFCNDFFVKNRELVLSLSSCIRRRNFVFFESLVRSGWLEWLIVLLDKLGFFLLLELFSRKRVEVIDFFFELAEFFICIASCLCSPC